MFIDTHCHLFWDSYDEDLGEVLARASLANVRQVIIPATDLATYKRASEIASEFEAVYCAVGIHPHDTAGLEDEAFEAVEAHAADANVVAIGEIGLDYYYADKSPKQDQHNALHRQLEIAKRCDLPVIIHNRDSDEDLLAICKEHQDGSLRGQFHCFSSSPEYAEQVLEAGFHISFTGNVTFKKTDLDEQLRVVPDDRLLIETDSPFMTPVPYRGKRNEPSYVPLIAEYYASIRGVAPEHIARITTENARSLYHLPEPSDA
ncbi:MAG: hydrolase TatD [Ectothiorhodospiraceae bacterium]|nr:hydrolase TatD [Ectothiorhodospiraceae bacterium]